MITIRDDAGLAVVLMLGRGEESRVALKRRDARLLVEPPPDATGRFAESVADALAGRRLSYARALHELGRQRLGLAEAAACLTQALANGRTVLVAGNGGSAAEAQHFAAELVGRFKRERAPYPVLALTADSAIVTSIGNDYGFHEIFSRQVRGFGHPGDVLVLFSTSGESRNLLQAAEAAHRQQMPVVALAGAPACSLLRLADHGVCVPDADTALAQEIHLLLTHILCDIVERELAAREGGCS
jgi:D-sedoheptulose 7-phosphate isomerase